MERRHAKSRGLRIIIGDRFMRDEIDRDLCTNLALHDARRQRLCERTGFEVNSFYFILFFFRTSTCRNFATATRGQLVSLDVLWLVKGTDVIDWYSPTTKSFSTVVFRQAEDDPVHSRTQSRVSACPCLSAAIGVYNWMKSCSDRQ